MVTIIKCHTVKTNKSSSMHMNNMELCLAPVERLWKYSSSRERALKTKLHMKVCKNLLKDSKLKP